MMSNVTVRYPQQTIVEVRRIAKQKGIDEAQVWRELVSAGLINEGPDDSVAQTALNFSIQSLCLSRRIAGHLDENIISLSNEDARRTMAKIRGEEL